MIGESIPWGVDFGAGWREALTMLIIAGYLQVAPDEREEYLVAAAAATVMARGAPGCNEFVQAADPIEADRVVIYERWDSERDLVAFRESDPEGDHVPVPALFGAEVWRYEIASVGPP